MSRFLNHCMLNITTREHFKLHSLSQPTPVFNISSITLYNINFTCDIYVWPEPCERAATLPCRRVSSFYRFSVCFPYCHIHETASKLTVLRCTPVISEIFQLKCPIFDKLQIMSLRSQADNILETIT